VLYPAGRPDTPEKPNRPRLIVMAIALGLFAGVGLTFGREYLDRSVYDARSLSAFEVPILAEIPHIPAA
jgi:capsular polysaccharide biosynthesis protein